MTNTNNGGPAFPLPPVSHNGKVVALTEGVAQGMTLRDYFAGQALIACRNHSNAEWLAKRAYEISDAMLRAREAS